MSLNYALRSATLSIRYFCPIIILVVLLLVCPLMAQELPAEEEIPDSIQTAVPDSAIEPAPFYDQIADSDSLVIRSFFPHVISNSTDNLRIPYSLADLLKTRSGFGELRLGPFGQSSYLLYGGRPVDRFVMGDFVFDYARFSLPANGLTDARMIPPGGSERLYFGNFDQGYNNRGLYLFHPAIPDSGSLTNAYMQKGDFGFSNTMIRFGSRAFNRAAFGFTADFKQSGGYITASKKDLEDFRLYTYYQLNDKYQLQPDIIFFNADDELRFPGFYADYKVNSESDFVGISLALASSDKSSLLNRTAFVYQRFTETVRGVDDKYLHRSESYRLKVENGAGLFGWDHYFTLEPYVKKISFNPRKVTYAGADFADYSTYTFSPKFELNLSLSASIAENQDPGLALAFGERYGFSENLAICGQIFGSYEIPRDFELFAHSPEFVIIPVVAMSGVYMFEGNSKLDNTSQLGYNLALEAKQGTLAASFYFKQAFISDLYLWEEGRLPDDSKYSTPISRNAEWILAGADLLMTLPSEVNARIAYSYCRLFDPDNDRYLTFAPRHNLYASLIRELYIERFNLQCLANLEGEYHSANYIDPINPVKLDDYMLMNFKLHFKIKKLTIFYNMDNVFNKPHRTVYDYESRRAVWWGFVWSFLN
jgi:hypothetical protein